MQTAGYMLGREERNVDSTRSEQVKAKRAGQADTIYSKNESGTVKAGDIYTTNTKVLTAFEYRGDRDLFEEVNQNNASLSPPQNLIIALKAMNGIQALHDLRILHKDIKQENFVLNGQGQSLTVMPIDFDMSQQLRIDQKEVINLLENGQPWVQGTPGFIAPEIKQYGKYSYASDIYALGVMLKEMNLPEEIYKPMVAEDPQNRRSLSAAMRSVVIELSKPEYGQNLAVNQALTEYQNFNKKIVKKEGIEFDNMIQELESLVNNQKMNELKGWTLSELLEDLENKDKKQQEQPLLQETLDELDTLSQELDGVLKGLPQADIKKGYEQPFEGDEKIIKPSENEAKDDRLYHEISKAISNTEVQTPQSSDDLEREIKETEAKTTQFKKEVLAEPQPQQQPQAKITLPEAIDKAVNNFNERKLQDLYNRDPKADYEILEGKKMGKAGGALHMYQQAKSQAKSLFGGPEKREKELESIKTIFEQLNINTQLLPGIEGAKMNAKIAMVFLDDLSKSTKSSTVKAVCEGYKKEITTRVPEAEKPDDTFRKQYQAILEKAEPFKKFQKP